jgi:hypothetical protein
MTGSGMRPLDLPCGEQGKLLPPRKFILPERDINMSEQEKQKSSFMQDLDAWTEAHVAKPLLMANATPEYGWDSALEAVKKAIRAKVLESYRNGQAAGPKQPVQKERRRVQR